jgi:hypothetical protein
MVGARLNVSALSGADDITTIRWALAPMLLGIVFGRVIDLGEHTIGPPIILPICQSFSNGIKAGIW